MSFVFKKKVLSSIMAATMAAGFAVSQNTAAIHLAEDHVGQVLLAPIYLAKAEYGYDTEFTIVNTRTDVAVKAKVTVRSAGHSQEALDFICYLTPADVCKFQIRRPDGSFVVDGKDRPYIWSDDDSIKAEDTNPPKFASQIQGGFKQRLKEEIRVWPTDPNDTATMGHIEVVGIYAAEGTINTAPVWGGVQAQQSVPVTVRREMPKMDVARIFDTPRNTDASRVLTTLLNQGGEVYPLQLDTNLGNNPIEASTLARGRLVNGVCVTSPANSAAAGLPCSELSQSVDVARIRSTDPRAVRLTGTARLINSASGDRMGYKIPALAGEIWDQVDPAYSIWENGIADPLGVGEAAINIDTLRWAPPSPLNTPGRFGFDGRVIANPTYDQSPAEETSLGRGMGSDGAHNVLEIEHALAASFIRNEYEDNQNRIENGVRKSGNKATQLVVTFPTKYMHRGRDVCNTYLQHAVAKGNISQANAAITYTVPFTPAGKVPYALSVYDNQEHTQTVTQSIVFSPQPISLTTLELPAEVNYFVPTWPTTTVGVNNYESGWFSMELKQQRQTTHFGSSVGCDYAGVPVLSMSHNYLTNNGISNSWLTPNAHSPELINRQYGWAATGNGY